MLHSDNEIVFSAKKEMSYQVTKRYRENLSAYCEVKGANMKRLQTVWFQLYYILEKANLQRQYNGQWLTGVCVGEEMNRQITEEFTAVKILCVILWWWRRWIYYDIFVQTHGMYNKMSDSYTTDFGWLLCVNKVHPW